MISIMIGIIGTRMNNWITGIVLETVKGHEYHNFSVYVLRRQT